MCIRIGACHKYEKPRGVICIDQYQDILYNVDMKIVGCGGLGPNEKREPIDRFSIEMTGAEKPGVLLIATPKAKTETFNEALIKARQHYEELGVHVDTLYDVFDTPPTVTEIEHKIGQAALINVSGGDTLRAMERFRQWGVLGSLKEAANRDTVLTGTSAGAISWFTRGHSDSLSYRTKEGESWDYIWVEGLDFQPGVICPHYNSATAGGEGRAVNLARMILQSETPISDPIYGIDNRAAIVIDGSEILSLTVDPAQRVHVIDAATGYSAGELPLTK
jgi:peptidase E